MRTHGWQPMLSQMSDSARGSIMGRTAKPPSHKSRQAASDDVKWAAIVAHDRAYDGRFYYSVDTDRKSVV